MDCHPTLEEYRRLAANHGVVPVWREIAGDLETPISAFLKLCPSGDGYLLESVEGNEKVARYSFIGRKPFLTLRHLAGTTEILMAGVGVGAGGEGCGSRSLEGNPLDHLRDVLQELRAPELSGLPRFAGGLVGYLAYDVVRCLEPLGPGRAGEDGLPEAYLMAVELLVIFDHALRRVYLVANVPVGKDPDGAYQRSQAIINGAEAELMAPLTRSAPSGLREILEHRERNPTVPGDGRNPAGHGGAGDPAGHGCGGNPTGRGGMRDPAARGTGVKGDLCFRSNLSREAFLRGVRQAKEHIVAGDIFQVVLSQRFETDVPTAPFEIYRVLRRTNPSPYMFFLSMGDLRVIGSSPELLVRVEDGKVSTRPIAGTRPRGSNEATDLALERELLHDEKERAEHIMLVDLGRNDVGKVARYGTVQVEPLMKVERYSQVMHIVSEVTGTLAEGKDSLDAFAACFPAGTLTGAPKVRAMQIIDDIEPDRRGLYGGAVGYFGFSGNLDTCIAIRTISIHGGKARIQAGAGIVADSDPEREYQETLDKAGALLGALREAAK